MTRKGDQLGRWKLEKSRLWISIKKRGYIGGRDQLVRILQVIKMRTANWLLDLMTNTDNLEKLVSTVECVRVWLKYVCKMIEEKLERAGIDG